MQHQAYINASVDIRIPTEVESVNYNQIDKEKENLADYLFNNPGELLKYNVINIIYLQNFLDTDTNIKCAAMNYCVEEKTQNLKMKLNINMRRNRKMTNTLQVKLLSKNARMPERNHKTDAGYDIFSAETVVLEPQEKAVIKTDVAVSIPEGYVGLLTSRSGVSSKTYLVIETGKIDAGYHGNLGINIKNDEERDGIPFL